MKPITGKKRTRSDLENFSDSEDEECKINCKGPSEENTTFDIEQVLKIVSTKKYFSKRKIIRG